MRRVDNLLGKFRQVGMSEWECLRPRLVSKSFMTMICKLDLGRTGFRCMETLGLSMKERGKWEVMET
jgi:hypothetical protein